jgi:6-O-methylguanine DNA methyltransferase, ribonuclease-like domain
LLAGSLQAPDGVQVSLARESERLVPMRAVTLANRPRSVCRGAVRAVGLGSKQQCRAGARTHPHLLGSQRCPDPRRGECRACAKSRRTWCSPMGELLLVGDEQGLRALHLPGRRPRRDGWASVSAPFATAVEQLEVYFAGHRTVFDLPLGANGASFDHASGTASPGSHTDRRSATASSRAAWDVPTASARSGTPPVTTRWRSSSPATEWSTAAARSAATAAASSVSARCSPSRGRLAVDGGVSARGAGREAARGVRYTAAPATSPGRPPSPAASGRRLRPLPGCGKLGPGPPGSAHASKPLTQATPTPAQHAQRPLDALVARCE